MEIYELYHHGVKGMKWGVRKKQKTGFVDRLKRGIGAAKSINDSVDPKGKDWAGKSHTDGNWGRDPKSDARKKWDDITTRNIGPQKPKGDQGNWGRGPKSKSRQKWEDDNGINPNRPNGTKNDSALGKTLKNYGKRKMSEIKGDNKTSKGKNFINKILKI